MSLYLDKQKLYEDYVKELNSFRDYQMDLDETRESFNFYIQTDECTWKNIFDGKELVGFVIFGKGGGEVHPDADRGIAQAYVAPSHRRKGLMEDAVRDYASRHRGIFSLLVIDGNTYAKRYWNNLFTKMNYEAVSLDSSCIIQPEGEHLELLGYMPKAIIGEKFY